MKVVVFISKKVYPLILEYMDSLMLFSLNYDIVIRFSTDGIHAGEFIIQTVYTYKGEMNSYSLIRRVVGWWDDCNARKSTRPRTFVEYTRTLDMSLNCEGKQSSSTSSLLPA